MGGEGGGSWGSLLCLPPLMRGGGCVSTREWVGWGEGVGLFIVPVEVNVGGGGGGVLYLPT